jgi:hypothetical protein
VTGHLRSESAGAALLDGNSSNADEARIRPVIKAARHTGRSRSAVPSSCAKNVREHLSAVQKRSRKALSSSTSRELCGRGSARRSNGSFVAAAYAGGAGAALSQRHRKKGHFVSFGLRPKEIKFRWPLTAVLAKWGWGPFSLAAHHGNASWERLLRKAETRSDRRFVRRSSYAVGCCSSCEHFSSSSARFASDRVFIGTIGRLVELSDWCLGSKGRFAHGTGTRIPQTRFRVSKFG